jgi:hypothetical protein
MGGQDDSFGPAPQPGQAVGAVGEGKEGSSAITDTTPNVPSPGEEASIALATDVSCPPTTMTDSGYGGDDAPAGHGARDRVNHQTSEVAAATLETDRINAGHFAPIPGQAGPYEARPGAVTLSPGENSLRIPIKISGKGKPGHVLVNLAVDVEVVVEEDA